MLHVEEGDLVVRWGLRRVAAAPQPLAAARMGSLQLGQESPCSGKQLGREPRQARHLDAVRAVRASLLEPSQEDDVVAGLADRHVQVLHAWKKVAQLGEFVVVGGEDGLGADVLMKVLGDRPRDRHAVVGGRSPPDLVQQDQASLRGAVDDRRGLVHLHHEGGLAPGQAVGGPDPREHPVAHRQARSLGGNERAHLRHDLKEAGLAQHRALAGHVGAGEDRDPALFVQEQVVGDEVLAGHHRLDHRVAAGGRVEGEAGGDLGARVASGLGDFGQRGRDVQLRQPTAGPLHSGNGADELLPQSTEERLLHLGDPFFGAEHLLLPLLELGGEEALGSGEGLLPYEVLGNPREVGLGDFQVVAEGLVEADPKGRDPGVLPLPRLKAGDELLRAVAHFPKLVQLPVEALADHAALGQGCGCVLRDRLGHQRLHVLQRVQVVEERPQGGAAKLLARFREAGDFPCGEAQRQHVAGGAPSGADARGEAVEVADPGEGYAEGGARGVVVDELGHAPLPAADRVSVDQRRQQPRAEKAGAHGGSCGVEHREEGGVAFAGAQRLDQLQVAAGHGVQGHERARAQHPGCQEVVRSAGADLGHVGDEGAGGADQEAVAGLEPEAVEGLDPVAAHELVTSGLLFERPVRADGKDDARGRWTAGRCPRSASGSARGPRCAPPVVAGSGPAVPRRGQECLAGLRHQDLPGLEAGQRLLQLAQDGGDHGRLPGGHVDSGHAHRLGRVSRRIPGSGCPGCPSCFGCPGCSGCPGSWRDADRQRGHVVVALGLQKLSREDGAGRDRLHDLARYDLLGGRSLLHLLADRDPAAELDEAGQVLVQGLDRHPGQGHPARGPVVAAGEREPEKAGPFLGVVLEHLVEVAHPKEHEGVSVLGLDLAPLAHERRLSAAKSGLDHSTAGPDRVAGTLPPYHCRRRPVKPEPGALRIGGGSGALDGRSARLDGAGVRGGCRGTSGEQAAHSGWSANSKSALANVSCSYGTWASNR